MPRYLSCDDAEEDLREMLVQLGMTRVLRDLAGCIEAYCHDEVLAVELVTLLPEARIADRELRELRRGQERVSFAEGTKLDAEHQLRRGRRAALARLKAKEVASRGVHSDAAPIFVPVRRRKRPKGAK